MPPSNPLVPDTILPPPTTTNPIKFAGDTFRSVFDTGAEASFKISRKWEDVQSRAFGLDGLMHVFQPFTDFSYVKEDGPNPLSVLQSIDLNRLRSFAQSIFHNLPRLIRSPTGRSGAWVSATSWETRRDYSTMTWLELDTFVDRNFENLYDRTDYSNCVQQSPV